MDSKIIHKSRGSLKIGELTRYRITYESDGSEIPSHSSLWLNVKNSENIALRAGFLRGPYILYVDVRTDDFHHDEATFITADQPKFESNLSPGQQFTAELSLHTIKKRYIWVVDLVSQIIFSPSTNIQFEFMIGRSQRSLSTKCDELGTFDPNLVVNIQDTLDLWNLPLQAPQKKYHLVVLTHGLHSNTYADMFYIKEQIDIMAKKTNQCIIVKGFNGNVCKTEKGVKYLGSKLAEYIITDLYNEGITEISFIGHSLGGLVQTFAIAYIQVNFPWFFQHVIPKNFITLASPLLGIFTDNPVYVKAALMMGAVGRTGQDLGLQPSTNEKEPLLKLLPTGPTHAILKRFQNRTLYANAINDGIVPLYTSALLYLDWKGLKTVAETQHHKRRSTVSSTDSTGKIPSENEDVDLIAKATKSIMDPVNKAMSLWAPNVQFGNYQETKEKQDDLGKNTSQTNYNQGNCVVDDDFERSSSNNFPKASLIESATSILIPPLPTIKYLTDPSSREDVIIHDRIYTENDIPEKKEKKKTFMQNMDPLLKFEELEEDIARLWHRGMDWRKVLVRLEPDAHNNIIVRRRFANAYGWKVVDHLLENHFQIQNKGKQTNNNGRSVTPTDLKNTKEINEIMNRENNQEENKEIDLGERRSSHWVNEIVDNSLFGVGPTGMITNINEIFDNFKNWNLNNANGENVSYNNNNNNKDEEQNLQDTIIEGNFY
ncbi:hypothetical protein WICMUC_002996 [Wickerhamomyces mucosus]|uniref:DUF676 domain-containing protein n=1 Tax=Wickerhamomyces mucosus TaxID=1378264 RepID=A0A9P8TCV4_9ASCO|nr:hypothetical protein WICMUC_002996 [Wickerhamomyces mucosus]